MITITKTAVEKFKETINKQNNPQNVMVRINFGGFGWGGPKLQLTLDELKHENDMVMESNGITLIYNLELEKYLQNSTIDYSNSWFNRGFVVKSAALSSC